MKVDSRDAWTLDLSRHDEIFSITAS